MTWIKICGITNIEDGLKASSLGVNALGFVFAHSPRRVNPEMAERITLALPPSISTVGVFVNEDPDEVLRVARYCRLNALQFHGDESPEYCQKFFCSVFKTIRIKEFDSLNDMERYSDATLLLDTYSPFKAGGTGIPFPWEIALKAKERRNFILSGGLNPGNIGEAIKKIRPWGVDVSSGVETIPGEKDQLKMMDFVREVRKADESTE